MIAPRLLQRPNWERRLKAERCRKYDCGGLSGLETGEWWLTEHDRLFIVPCDEHGLLRTDDWQSVTIQIAKLKPIDLDS